MTDERALLAAIVREPDELTPRLMFADWLDEHGDEGARARAQFIRLQCGGTPEDWLNPSGTSRELTPQQRLHQHCFPGFELRGWNPDGRNVAYQRPYSGSSDLDVYRVRFAMGFVHELACFGSSWLTHARELAWCPKCPRCKGTKRVRVPARGNPLFKWFDAECDACRGTGHNAAPCPVTAQPLRRVVLERTAYLIGLDRDYVGLVGDSQAFSLEDVRREADRLAVGTNSQRMAELAVLSLRWPGIKFDFNDQLW
jgi:uncharacterized protein (TIGR02996 family)